jgi:uncharacterized protein (TIGR02453 family)
MNPYPFLEELAQNNNRPWFQANKERYEALRAEWYDHLERIIAAMSQWEPEMARRTARDCAFRIYRDTRFSPDKTPYKTYLSAAMSPYGRNLKRAGYYIQLDICDEESGIYGGLWCPEAPMLRKLRNAIVDNIEEFESIINEPELKRLYPNWIGRALKTAPKGWPKDHPQIELLRLTDYGKGLNLSRDFYLSPDWPERIAELMRPLKPLIDFLNYSIDEEL